MKSRLRTLGMASLLVSALALAAPPDAPSAGQSQKDLVIWGVNVGPDSKGVVAMLREFQRRNPDLNLRVLSMGSGGMNPQKLMTSIVGNVAPDVIAQDRFTISDWASRGAFRSLDDYIARDKGSDPLCPRREQYYPAVWEEAAYGGLQYAIPTDADNRALYWNRAIFREKAKELRAAGLDPERAPRTWGELLKYSAVLTEKNPDGTLKRAGYLPNFGNCWLYMYAFQNNASFMDPSGRKCTLYTPESEEALQFIVDGYKIAGGYTNAKAFESGFLGNENDAFIIGKVAMKVDGDWILNGLSRYAPGLDFGNAPPPVPDDRYAHKGRFANDKDTYVSWVGGFSYAIPMGAKNPEGAWRFIKFATSVVGRMIANRAQSAWEQKRGRVFIPKQAGNMEANEVAFAEFKPADPKFAAALKQHKDLMPVARIRPATFVGQMLWDEHVRALENACYGKMTPKEALLAGQATVQRGLDEFYDKGKYPVIDLSVPLMVGVGLVGVAALVLVGLFRRQRLGRLGRTEAKWAYLFVSPWVIGFLVLTLGPMLASLFFSFTQWNVLNEARFVGPKNYQDLVGIDRANVLKGLMNAGYLAGIGVPLGVFTGLSIALLLNAAVKGMRFYRTAFYVPAIVPTVASAILWAWILAADPNKGLLNAAWQSTLTQWFNAAPPGWINAESWSKDALIVMGIWGAGSGMILWLAGLKGVPTQLYEAASIDGANPRQQFLNVTLPQLSPIIFFNMVMGFIGAVQEFDRIYIMKPSDGPVGPADSLLSPVFLLFQNGFGYFKMGYASAIAWMIFVIILILTLIQFRMAPKWVHYEAEK
jgi:ABC-type sugar transport system permease subunit/ABC-type glycerol-3-phosphate transport system substrate-binding protein